LPKAALDEVGLESYFQVRTVIVCLCHAVRDRELDRAIADGAETVAEVGEQCGAGTGCGACIPEIEERLENAGRACDRGGSGDCPRTLVSVRSRNLTEPRDAA
jgi:bacterioferritin-associated ferredoxin